MARKKKDNALEDMIAAFFEVLPSDVFNDLLADYEASQQPEPHHTDYAGYDSGPVYQPTNERNTRKMLQQDLRGLEYLEEVGS